MSQPNPIDDLTAEAERRADVEAEDAAEAQPEYTGDMPDDPEQAVHYRPGEDR
jgi:hypothetical protein